MTHFAFTNFQFTFIFQFSFTKQAANPGLVCEMLNDKLLVNGKCKMVNPRGLAL